MRITDYRLPAKIMMLLFGDLLKIDNRNQLRCHKHRYGLDLDSSSRSQTPPQTEIADTKEEKETKCHFLSNELGHNPKSRRPKFDMPINNVSWAASGTFPTFASNIANDA